MRGHHSSSGFCLAGFVAYWSWVFCVLIAEFFLPDSAISFKGSLWMWATLFHVITLLLLSLAADRHLVEMGNANAAWIGGALMLAGLAIQIGTGENGNTLTAKILISAALVGVGTGCIILAWAELFDKIAIRDERRQWFLLLGIIAATALSTVLSFCPEAVLLVVFAILPVACALCIQLGFKHSAASPRKVLVEGKQMLPPKLILFCIVYSIPLGYVQTQIVFGSSGSISGWSPILLPSIAILLVTFLIDSLVLHVTGRSEVNQIVIPAIIAGVLLLALFDESKYLFVGILLFTAQQILSAVLYAAFGEIAHRGNVPVHRAFAIGISATDSGFLAGILLGNFVRNISPSNTGTVVMVIAYSLVIVGFLITGGFKVSEMKDQPQGKEVSQQEITPDECAAEIADEYNLTQREREILSLLIRGYSVPAISEELSLSKNTVRTHVSHIYQKVDVHGRDELISFAEHRNG